MILHQDIIKTPCGDLSLIFDDQDRLYHLDFPDQGDRQDRLLAKRFKTLRLIDKPSMILRPVFDDYFAGHLNALEKINCIMGGTAFQQTVWKMLRTIPAGQTWSYSDLAIKIGNERAVRAVARANALNPISLVVPCHRVIGKDGQLSGYAGGVKRKKWLLRHEGYL